MKSPKKNGIGEVVTDYGRRVMRIFKKGLLQRSLFDFYGDIKADSVKIKESSSVPGTPVDGDGGVVYIKSADGKLYFKSNEVSEVELSSSGATLTTEQVQDIVGAMFSSNTETNITVTYQDSDGTIDLVATDTNTQLTTEEVQDIVGAMFTSNTETRISATYEDSDGTIDLVVDDMTADTNTQLTNEEVQDIVGAMFTGNTETRISATYQDSDGTIDLVVNDIPVDLTVSGDGNIHADNVPTLNQSTTGNAATATASAGNFTVNGDLTVTGNDIKDDDGTTCITFDSSGNTSIGGTLSCADLDITGAANALTINSTTGNVAINASSTDADCMVRVSDNSTAGTNAIGMVGTGDDLVMRNDEGNFKVKMANNATTTLDLDQSGNLTVTGIITGKQREIYSQSFLDDLGTTKHFLPFKDINEQTTIYQEEAAMLMPCDGRIVSVTVRTSSITGSGNMTIGVNTIAPNINQFSTSNWTEEETETLAVTSTDDYHVFHFAFSNAKHFDSGDLVTISIQNDTDLSGNTFWYVSTVVEYDWGTYLGTTSAEYDSNP
tara:strand:+ start:468 stop:2117 length:1650 start_codon:yes stop_codon:yes gene_type:complete